MITFKRRGGGLKEISVFDAKDFYHKMSEDGTIPWVFPDRKEFLPSDFWSEIIDNKQNMCFLLYYNHEPASLIWLDKFSGKSACFNFCVLKDFFSKTPLLAEAILNVLLTGEEPYVKALYGLTPKLNRAAVKTALNSGFEFVAELPYTSSVKGRVCSTILTKLEAKKWVQKCQQPQ